MARFAEAMIALLHKQTFFLLSQEPESSGG